MRVSVTDELLQYLARHWEPEGNQLMGRQSLPWDDGRSRTPAPVTRDVVLRIPRTTKERILNGLHGSGEFSVMYGTQTECDVLFCCEPTTTTLVTAAARIKSGGLPSIVFRRQVGGEPAPSTSAQESIVWVDLAQGTFVGRVAGDPLREIRIPGPGMHVISATDAIAVAEARVPLPGVLRVLGPAVWNRLASLDVTVVGAPPVAGLAVQGLTALGLRRVRLLESSVAPGQLLDSASCDVLVSIGLRDGLRLAAGMVSAACDMVHLDLAFEEETLDRCSAMLTLTIPHEVCIICSGTMGDGDQARRQLTAPHTGESGPDARVCEPPASPFGMMSAGVLLQALVDLVSERLTSSTTIKLTRTAGGAFCAEAQAVTCKSNGCQPGTCCCRLAGRGRSGVFW